ncbi:MAG: MBOAT family O-acyltransferase [Deltaproteobacteria bacterium]|jgi:alginate O-acetyltransferase complex protein AlgI
MLFDAVPYLFFLALVLPASWLVRGRPRQLLLLAASYLFYGWWDWRFLALIALSTVIDYVCARRIEAAHEDDTSGRGYVVFSVVSQLLILGYFKYAGFFVSSMQEGLQMLGVATEPLHLSIVLPVGISFYTFQTMSYTIDVYRRAQPAERDPLRFALFVAWFPQLVAGPIERASRLLPQLDGERRFDPKLAADGVLLILWGLTKKMLLADRAAVIVDRVFDAPAGTYGAIDWYIAALAFAIQIYGDFSGYTDIARGTSRLFGVELTLNFRHPYLAIGPRDFWRRWHISLSRWLRDYLYVSLGGNRGGAWRTRLNLFLTMLLGGLWHGAAWHFVAWGVYHGVLLGIERALGIAKTEEPRLGVRVARVFVMLQLTVFGWVLFRIPSLTLLGDIFGSFGKAPSAKAGESALALIPLVIPMVIMHVVQLRTDSMEVFANRRPATAYVLATTMLVCLLTFFLRTRVQFIYFQF